MGKNYIVIRRSPHWPTFDLADSRGFCAANGLPTELIVNFAQLWDATSSIDFRTFRHAMKRIAHRSLLATGATIVDARDLNVEALEADDALIPIDDDDWLHPQVFEVSRHVQVSMEGCIWGSVRIGKIFADNATHDLENRFVYLREIDDNLYTNNYSITGISWKTRSYEEYFEHFHAQQTYTDGRLILAKSQSYLSATNKHLCATTCVNHNMGNPDFVSNISDAINQTVTAVESVGLNTETAWMGNMIDELAEVMRACQR